jgi:hypothetical protein
MKNKQIELDVDFIGGQGPLTKEEEQLLRKIFQARKSTRSKTPVRKPKPALRKKSRSFVA